MPRSGSRKIFRGIVFRGIAGAAPALLAVLLALSICGCGSGESGGGELILATTTSTRDSGLLDEWVPMFEREYPYSVKVIAVGSGAALEMARKGEADVLLVHDPEGEDELMREGYGIERAAVMHNDFILVGPPTDPAGIKGMEDAAEAFRRIGEGKYAFLSRGDNSGTHVREKALWEAAGIQPSGTWYVESGKGMGDTLRIADDRGAYTLTDRGTWLALKRDLGLEQMVQGDRALFNEYHVIVVNPAKWPAVNAEGAGAFAGFVTGQEAQRFLTTFGVDRFGEPLFYPDALPGH